MGIGLERTNSFNMMVLLKVVLFFFFGYFYQMIKLSMYDMYDIKHTLNSEGRFIFSNKISSLSVFNFFNLGWNCFLTVVF